MQRKLPELKKIGAILELVLKNPCWGSHTMSAKFPRIKGKPLLSNRGVYKILVELDLETRRKRRAFVHLNKRLGRKTVSEILANWFALAGKKRLSARERLTIISRVEMGEPVKAACSFFGISRKNFYKWRKRYKEAPQNKKESALIDRRPEIGRYWRQIPEWEEKKVLEIILSSPELSAHKIVKVLPEIAGKPLIGNHGVQNILRRHRLSTYEARLAYQRAQEVVIKPVPVPSVAPVFNLPLRLFRMILSLFATIPKKDLFRVFGLAFISSFFLSNITYLFLRMVSQAPVENKIGLLFASIALATGSFFFLYSLKYYLTMAFVLGFSRHAGDGGGNEGNGHNNNSNGYGNHSWLAKFLGLNGNGNGKGYTGGLQPNLDHIKLERYPFVSIHLPMYNEKKVVNRLLTACTSMDYENYEVVVVDDSTDETTQILNDWKNHPRVKIIHRETREGFKGGALKVALEKTDKRAEFVLVFDSDFIPYPDTITQFLKYFQSVAGTLDFAKASSNQRLASSLNQLNANSLNARSSKIAAIQGYQWHVLNKSENWITRGVRSEYAGNYVVERSGAEVYGGLKQIAGSVYMIRKDILDQFGWQTSITEDFQLTLRLYEQGYKVVYTPYVQGPAECVSTIKRLVRQRMRWAEGHSFNVRKMAVRLLFSPKMTLIEKLEFLYLSPYYLQAFFFMLGTFCWLISETVFKARLPFWTSLWGWSLVLTNMFALPLMNTVGLFLEESEERDYLGILSFVALSYLLVPFQAYASIKGFLEKEEGPWFRTPKTGLITDIFTRGRFYRWISGILPGRQPAPAVASAGVAQFITRQSQRRINSANPFANPYVALATANNQFSNFAIRPRHFRWLGNLVFTLFIFLTSALMVFAPLLPLATVSANETGRVITGNGQPVVRERINSQVMVKWDGGEVIFHQEQRIRYKFESYEIELTTLRADGIGNTREAKSYREGPLFVYPEVFPNADLIYKVRQSRINESLLLKKYQPIEFLEQRLRLTDLIVAKTDNGEIVFASKTGGQDLFTFNKPYMYEEGNPIQRSEAIVYELEKRGGEYLLRKRLTEEGKKWLTDPSRQFPVVIDPTIVQSNVLASGATAQETQFAPNQRKIAYMPNASGGAAWYAFHSDGNIIRYKKCAASSLCDADGDWSANVAVDVDGDAGDSNPSIFVTGDDIWIAWIDNTTAGTTAPYTAIDALQWRKLTTTTDAFNTMCTTVDVGSLGYTPMAYIAAGTNGDVVVGYVDTAGDSEANIFEISSGTSCAAQLVEATYSIETGSGLCTGTCSIQPVVIGIGNNIHIIYDDGANIINHSLRDVNGNAWTFADKVADNGNVYNNSFSVTTDGSSLWLLYRDTATTTVLQKCTGTCMTSSGGAWTNLTAPWTSGLTSADPPTITYISGTTRLKACIVDGSSTTSQNVVCKDTDASTINWGSQFSIGFTASDFVNLSSPVSVANADQMAIVVLDVTNSAFKFATVPERLLILLLLAPFLPGVLRRIRESRRGLWKTK